MAKKKEKKKDLILKELNRRLKNRKQFCELNGCEPTTYMLGATNEIKELIGFVELL